MEGGGPRLDAPGIEPMQLRDKNGRFAGWLGPKNGKTAPTPAMKSPKAPSTAGDKAGGGYAKVAERFSKTRVDTPTLDEARSNTSTATLMELMTARQVARAIGIPFEYNRKLLDVYNRLKTTHPETVTERAHTQIARVNLVAPKIAGLLRNREAVYGAITHVEHLGDNESRSLDATTADLRFHHESGMTTDISLKSTFQGSGTARNIGSASMKALVDVDADLYTSNMYEHVLVEIEEKDPERAKELQAMSVRDRKYAFTEEEKEIAAEVGRAYTSQAALNFYDKWPELSGAQKAKFLSAAMGIDENAERLFVAVVNDDGAEMKRPKPLPPTSEIIIFYAPDNPQQVKFYHDRKLLLRTMVHCSNGLGLSTMCMRTYLR